MKGTSYDTRFLVELFYSSDEDTQNRIRDVLLASKPNFLSTAALSEVYMLTLEKEGKDVAIIRTNSLAKDFRLVDVDKEVAVQAAIIKHKHGVPFADSLIASTAKVLGVPCYTDDQHFRAIIGLTVKWIR
ncbi:MAG: PIN domain-containing protein [Thaumarchaeota archaeon]|nr:PIN domain-containing protein [Nitrososphaerota archaeon]